MPGVTEELMGTTSWLAQTINPGLQPKKDRYSEDDLTSALWPWKRRLEEPEGRLCGVWGVYYGNPCQRSEGGGYECQLKRVSLAGSGSSSWESPDLFLAESMTS